MANYKEEVLQLRMLVGQQLAKATVGRKRAVENELHLRNGFFGRA